MSYTVGMVLLDIIAPILLMLGVKYGTSGNASLLGNFEIVATTLIAMLIFKEKVTWRLWTAILLITASSIILTFESTDGMNFSVGSLLVLGQPFAEVLKTTVPERFLKKVPIRL